MFYGQVLVTLDGPRLKAHAGRASVGQWLLGERSSAGRGPMGGGGQTMNPGEGRTSASEQLTQPRVQTHSRREREAPIPYAPH